MQKHNKNFEVKIINEEKNSRIKTKTFKENSEKKKKNASSAFTTLFIFMCFVVTNNF